MRRIMFILLAASTLLAAPALAKTDLQARGEAELARLLSGRVAGAPQSCITLRPNKSSRVVNRTAIVYDGPGDTIYVNRPRSGARSLNQFNILVTKQFSDRLCRTDTVRTFDPASRMMTGIVFLDDFVPYRKRDGRTYR